MNAVSDSFTPLDTLVRISAGARHAGLPYAGDVVPDLAQALVEADHAVLIDVRSPEEIRFVGHVPGAINVPWATGLVLTRNPRFLRALENAAPIDAVILLLCRRRLLYCCLLPPYAPRSQEENGSNEYHRWW